MKKITYAAVIAAIYAALTICLAPISFGFLQVRVSEALSLLPLMSPSAIPGLFLGCLVANFVTGNILDVVLGSAATLLSAVCTYLTRSNKWIAALFPVLINAVVVGGYMSVFVDNSHPVWLYMISILVGQAIACYGIGMPLYGILKKIYKKNAD